MVYYIIGKSGGNMITIDDIRKNKEVLCYINGADYALKEMGYTEHALAHVETCVNVVTKILSKLNYDQETINLAQIAAFMHDIGNVINRNDHAHSGAVMSFRILDKLGMDAISISKIINAIGNHDESSAYAVSPISAALILADKSDVRRTRVRQKNVSEFDIHDKVNYAVTKKEIEFDGQVFMLKLTIDTEISSIMNYFEIFLKRMLLCQKASEYLNIKFALNINGTKML